MYIGIASKGATLEDIVPDNFDDCSHLLIIKIEDDCSEILECKALSKSDYANTDDLARELINYNCELIITGMLTVSQFDLIADACITRYIGSGIPVLDSIGLMSRDALNLLRNPEGTDDCDGDHHHEH